MNQMLSIFMGGYTDNMQPSFRLDTNKGYYFTGLVEESFSPDVNFDDFSDNERLVKFGFVQLCERCRERARRVSLCPGHCRPGHEFPRAPETRKVQDSRGRPILDFWPGRAVLP